ncbi:hypothetical protein ASG21_05590 [Chryseobacterium sp. Leaf394]|nr:hypothetical protein ASG21_05590 [Chryseobacterium sp. Leaf394]
MYREPVNKQNFRKKKLTKAGRKPYKQKTIVEAPPFRAGGKRATKLCKTTTSRYGFLKNLLEVTPNSR